MKGNSGGNGFDGKGIVEIFGTQSCSCATASRSCCITNVGSICVISPKGGSPSKFSKWTGTLPTLSSRTISCAPFLGNPAAQRERGAERGMAGERQFFLHSEDADANALLALGGGIAGQDECGLGEIHLLGDRLHLGVGSGRGRRGLRRANCLRVDAKRKRPIVSLIDAVVVGS